MAQFVNTLFGRIQRKYPVGTETYAENAIEFENNGDRDSFNASVNDYVGRNLLFDKEIKKADMMTNIRLNPTAYLKAKNDDLLEMAGIATLAFKDYLNELMKNGMKQKEAIIKANELVKKYNETLKVLHKEKFPYSEEFVAKNMKY